MPTEGGEPVPVLETPVFELNWTLWKENIVYLNETTDPPTIEILNLNTGRVRALHRLASGMTFSFGVTVSPDGNDILYGQWDQTGSDLVLVENFK